LNIHDALPLEDPVISQHVMPIPKKQKANWDGMPSMELMKCVLTPGAGNEITRMDMNKWQDKVKRKYRKTLRQDLQDEQD